jgi:uncharacterized protein (TIGR03083 family)
MTDYHPLRAKCEPGVLRLTTAGPCEFDVAHLLEVFGEQRRRFVAVLREFGPADWAARTRCAEWSAHDVIRHLCDCNAIAAGAVPDDNTLDIAAGFDPRITPRGWLTASARESPPDTLRRFEATTEEMLAGMHTRLARSRRFDVRLPYGPVDWTVLVLHGFWDSWLHERDVLLARGAEHPTDGEAIGYAAAYGLFIAAAVALRFGDRVEETITLGGAGGGVFDLDSRDAITLTVSNASTEGPPATQVTDALAGRPPAAAVLGDLPPGSLAALSRLANFLNSPVEQSRA